MTDECRGRLLRLVLVAGLLSDSDAQPVCSEQYGLSRDWLEGADTEVMIPMPGSVDSLNAAMAAGIVVFEAVRQRS